MGVVGLWNVISPAGEPRNFSQLRGKKLAIDLSCWIVDSQTVITNDGVQKKYLRTLFFRIAALLLNGITPVFVLEGAAPKLKYDVIQERNNKRQQQAGVKPKEAKERNGRGRNFTSVVNECETLINLMGLQCIRAQGEAEAMCAFLNADGVVDGCVTQDSDCFLYGAKVVYRKFTVNDKSGFGSSAEEFSLDRLKTNYNLGRNKMIAMALLCGCDYHPGVPGIGKEKTNKFLRSADEESILEKMKSWRNDSSIDQIKQDIFRYGDKESMAIELDIRKKCLDVEGFPNQELIDEFTTCTVQLPKTLNKWKYPNLKELIKFMEKKVKWIPRYTMEKVLPLRTRWQVENLRDISLEIAKTTSEYLIPICIKKIRNLMSVGYFEIEWNYSTNEEVYIKMLLENENTEEKDNLGNLITVEPQEMVENSYPELVTIFEASRIKPKKTTRKKKDNSTSDDKNNEVKSSRGRKKKDLEKNKKIDDFFVKKISTNVKSSNKNHRKIQNHNDQEVDDFLTRLLETKAKHFNENPQDNQIVKLNQMNKIQTDSPVHKKRCLKSNSAISNFLANLDDEDFGTDAEGDLEMSMIVSKVCRNSNDPSTSIECEELVNIPNLPKDTDAINENRANDLGIIRESIEINLTEDSSDDEEVEYIPLCDRIKSC